eukprot:scaffold152985_cov23-Tisochrysis_lutea.AAC.2
MEGKHRLKRICAFSWRETSKAQAEKDLILYQIRWMKSKPGGAPSARLLLQSHRNPVAIFHVC